MSSDSSVQLNSKEEVQMAGSAESQTNVLNEELLKTLECPVCFKYMTSTIHSCVSGHSICAHCKQQGVTICPVCRAALISARNYLAEEMTKHILFPCENKDRGCTMTVLGSEIKQHHVNCSYRIYKCPMKYTCTWTGGREQLTKHYTDKHPRNIIKSRVMDWPWKGFLVAAEYYCLLCTYEKVFLWFGYVNPNKRCLTSCVHYIGDAEEAAMFSYTITLKSEDGSHSLSYTDLTKNDSSDLATIMQSTKLFSANEDTYKNFAGKGGEVNVTIEVSKVKNK